MRNQQAIATINFKISLITFAFITCSTYVHADSGQISFSGKIVEDASSQSVQTYINKHAIKKNQLQSEQIPKSHPIYSHSDELPPQVESVTPMISKTKNGQVTHITYTIQYY